MKVAVFENEYDSVKGAFEASNLLDFESKMEFFVFPSSQKADFATLAEYSAIFVDIDLSAQSDLDGYALIQKIVAIDKNLLARVIILTGNNKIEENLKERGISSSAMQIIIKPTNYEEITLAIKKCLIS